MSHTRKLRLARIVTVPMTFSTLLHQQINVIAENNIEISLISSPGVELESLRKEYSIPCFPIPMSRFFTPIADVRSLLKLISLYRSNKFDIVHSSTPKAGILSAVASWFTHIPIRLHTYTGQTWVEMRGLIRYIAKLSDKIIGSLTTECYADSDSQREFLINEGIVPSSKITVLASGSISGVDLKRFDPAKWKGTKSAATRSELGILKNSLVILFMGRITRDKGVIELVEAFIELKASKKVVDLVLVGPFESLRNSLPQRTIDILKNNSHIHLVGFSAEPERYLSIADVFCLPSYREGFGSVVIESAAMGVPAVATSVTGLVDAVVKDETGLLVPPKDITGLRKAIETILCDSNLRNRLGKSARSRAVNNFDAVTVNNIVAKEYWKLYNHDMALEENR